MSNLARRRYAMLGCRAEVGMRWSAAQRAVFEDVAGGDGHTVVMARAGSGKTTTIVQALERVPRGDVMLVAFNKAIAAELGERAPAGVEVRTLHSYGLRAVRRAYGNVRVEQHKTRRSLEELGYQLLRDERQAVQRTVSLCKAMLVDECDDIDRLADSYDIDAGDTDAERDRFVAMVQAVLLESTKQTGEVDFDDMIWLPVVKDLRLSQFDRIFIDETQDLNAAQLELSARACRDGGRICAVGDDAQSIYQFRGADSNAIGRVVRELDAKTLPLTTSYRCAKTIAALAAEYVPDFSAHESNPEGVVNECKIDQMRARIRPGDFLLSRTNAPLISQCLGLIRDGVPAEMRGRDVGAGLVKLVEKSRATTATELDSWLRAWAKTETARLLKRDPDANTELIDDKVACIHALSEGLTTTAQITARIDELFGDSSNGARVICSSTHKAKGLEAERVFLLRYTYLQPRRGQELSQEEKNLFYVAVTRAKHELTLVR